MKTGQFIAKIKYPVACLILIIMSLVLVIAGCGTVTTTTTATMTTTITETTYSLPELEYLLLSRYSNFFWCDPDLYPIAREGQEQANAIGQFPTIRANTVEFSAIISHLGLPQKTDYTDAEKLEIYREYKKLTYALELTGAASPYNFTLRVGEGQGELIKGTITASGQITQTSSEPSFNTCPICLIKGTLIATPVGLVPVEALKQGMTVWTVDASGVRTAMPVIAIAQNPVPASFQVMEIVLADGRRITASPSHPTSDGRTLGSLRPGDILDGSTVVSAGLRPYDGGFTFDILPEGETGLYFANGVLLKSTLLP